ncbi:hypothetical protein [Streptomyces sp. NPDC017890]|uniref:hypothetical protein n=1 Tax=Streptomyces sp. NPDC017890 TaxID=3365015 RepID=UPI00378C3E34
MHPQDHDEARRLLAAALKACTHCQPDVQLPIIVLGLAGNKSWLQLWGSLFW